MTRSIVYEKSFNFAIRIVNLYKYLGSEKNEYVLSKQLLRSGTSVGANVKEALDAQSKKDFLAKMNIALKEAAETKYWLDQLIATNFLEQNMANSILEEREEIYRMLTSIVKTTKKKLRVDS